MHDAYGGAQPHISQGYVKDIEIELPDIKEQELIVQKLDRIIEAKSNREKAMLDVDKLINSIYKDSIESEGTIVKKLGEIGHSIIGLTYKPENITDDGILVLRSGNIQDGKLDFADQVRVNIDVKDKYLIKTKLKGEN